MPHGPLEAVKRAPRASAPYADGLRQALDLFGWGEFEAWSAVCRCRAATTVKINDGEIQMEPRHDRERIQESYLSLVPFARR